MHRNTVPPNRKFIFITIQCGGLAFQCIYLIPKGPADDQTNRHKITKGLWTTVRTYIRTEILYCHSGYFKPCPVAACAARNYWLLEWNFIAYLNPFFSNKNSDIIYIYIFIYYYYYYSRSFIKKYLKNYNFGSFKFNWPHKLLSKSNMGNTK